MSKKTVGIITMHKVPNFGSALQAYALQKVIIDMGYSCELIDYIYPNKQHLNKRFGLRILKTLFANLLNITDRARQLNKMKRQLKVFWRQYFILSKKTYHEYEQLKNYPPLYDIYITGSDQVWNPRFVKDDTSFLLSFAPKGAKKIAYSSSFACSTIDEKYIPIYKELLKSYSFISVREKNGVGIINNLLKKEIPVTLDPTLLLKATDWVKVFHIDSKKTKKKEEEYILAYVLKYAFEVTPYIYELIKKVQSDLKIKVLYIGLVPHELEQIATPIMGIGPLAFVELFKNASFVVTSSFHGTSFAVNFGIPFYSVINNDPSKDDRQLSLLKEIGLENRAVPVGTEYSTIKNEWLPNQMMDKLNEKRENSLKYLYDALNN